MFSILFYLHVPSLVYMLVSIYFLSSIVDIEYYVTLSIILFKFLFTFN